MVGCAKVHILREIFHHKRYTGLCFVSQFHVSHQLSQLKRLIFKKRTRWPCWDIVALAPPWCPSRAPLAFTALPCCQQPPEFFRRFHPHVTASHFLSVSCRMIVELHRKVSSLIEFLKQKWALHEVRIVSFLLKQHPPPPILQHLLPENGVPRPTPEVARGPRGCSNCAMGWCRA